MSNPVLVEVLRGPLTESRHRGAVCVMDADGATVFSLGDVAVPVYPRSAVKPIQALPLVESGAADRYGFGDEELALACASHGAFGGALRHRRLRDPLMGGAALRFGIRFCALWHRPWPCSCARQGGGALAWRLRGATVLCRRYRSLLHRDHDALSRPRAGQD